MARNDEFRGLAPTPRGVPARLSQAQAFEIERLCAKARMPQLAAIFIRDRRTVDEVIEELFLIMCGVHKN